MQKYKFNYLLIRLLKTTLLLTGLIAKYHYFFLNIQFIFASLQ